MSYLNRTKEQCDTTRRLSSRRLRREERAGKTGVYVVAEMLEMKREEPKRGVI